MEYSGLFKGINSVAEWVMRLSITNLLWVFFNLPIVFLGLTALVAESTEQLITIGTTAAILSPFFFFPATSAMFAVVRKWVMNEKDIPLVRTYWKYYKENYVKSLISGIIIGLLWIIYAIDYYYFTNHVSENLILVLLVFALFLLVFTLNIICNIVHYEIKLLATLKNALLYTIGSPIVTIVVGIFNLGFIYFSFTTATYLIPFFLGSVISLVTFSGFYRMYLKVQALNDQKE